MLGKQLAFFVARRRWTLLLVLAVLSVWLHVQSRSGGEAVEAEGGDLGLEAQAKDLHMLLGNRQMRQRSLTSDGETEIVALSATGEDGHDGAARDNGISVPSYRRSGHWVMASDAHSFRAALQKRRNLTQPGTPLILCSQSAH